MSTPTLADEIRTIVDDQTYNAYLVRGKPEPEPESTMARVNIVAKFSESDRFEELVQDIQSLIERHTQPKAP